MYDYLIVGGGIVGVSTAWQLQQQNPGKKILLLDKEEDFACHQTGHNSGVIHAGVYYQPGSLKADFCRRGAQATVDFCKQQGIPFEVCGKLIVATNPVELARMECLHDRCQQNGIKVEKLTADQLQTREPNVVGLGALWVASTGITDYQKVAQAMADCFVELGGEFSLATEVTAIAEQPDCVRVTTAKGEFHTRFLISCAGLMADRLVTMMGLPCEFQIVPFRGEYYQLPVHHNDIVNHLIYPVPDPELPFLGVHLTRMIDGSVTVGPNAVLGWKREGYARLNFSWQDSWQMLGYPGFWKTIGKNLQAGLSEWRDSLWKRGYLKRVQKYCPQIQLNELQPYPAGIRAQAVLRDGTLVHDFLFAESPRSLHVCNAPSPAATSAIPIGEYICEQVKAKLG